MVQYNATLAITSVIKGTIAWPYVQRTKFRTSC